MRRRRREQELAAKGFRDALVVGLPDPGQPEFGVATAEEPYYRRGFKDGERAVKRIVRLAQS